MSLHTKTITRELVACRDEPRHDPDLSEPGPPSPQRARSLFTTAAPATVLVLTANASLHCDLPHQGLPTLTHIRLRRFLAENSVLSRRIQGPQSILDVDALRNICC